MKTESKQEKRAMIRRTVYLPADEVERLQEHARKEDRSVSYILAAVLRGWDGQTPKA